MTNPVAPKEGHYALLRNGGVVHPECITKDFDLDGTPYYLPANSDEDYYWTFQGVCQRQVYPKGIPKLIFVPDCDIIATISPADMQALASGEIERLRAENEKLRLDRGFAIGWIKGLANNPHKPMTWMQTREAAADFVAALEGSQ